MINELNKKYNDVQTLLHKFSLSPAIAEETELTNATLKSGHTVSYNEVRAEQIPAYKNKVELYDTILQYRSKDDNGNIITPSIDSLEVTTTWKDTIKFYNKELMNPIPDKSGYSWYVPTKKKFIDDDNEVELETYANDFISPTDVLVGGKDLSKAYTVEIYDIDGKIISPIYYTFDYYNGILTFNPDVTKKQINKWAVSANKAETGIKLTGFKYIGKYVNNYFKDLEESITEVKNYADELLKTTYNELSDMISTAKSELNSLITMNKELIAAVQLESLAIDKVKFDTTNMKSSDSFFEDEFNQTLVKTYKCEISGYCWDVRALDNSDIILADISHEYDDNVGWKSKIEIQVAVNKDGKIIPDYQNKDITFEKLEFEASIFTKVSGESIGIIKSTEILEDLKKNKKGI